MNTAPNDIADDRDEQAALWCLSLATGDLPADERDAFDDWIADVANATAFENVARVWQAVEGAAGSPELIRIRGAAIENYRRANRQRWTRRISAPWYWSAGIAAAIILAIVSLTMLRDPIQLYETRIGERRIAILDDQSRLSLDADSRVEVGLSDDRRALTLVRGRAKFDVAKDSLRPFTVVAGDKMVIATGTSFSVERIGRQIRVLLYEGHVEVVDRNPQTPRAVATGTALTPGSEMVALVDASGAVMRQADPAQSISWESGQLSFDDEPIALAVARMNRYSNTKLALGGAGASRFVVNGVFAAGDVEAFAEAVTSLHPLEATRSPGVVTLKATEKR